VVSPLISSIFHCRFALREAVSKTVYCISLKVKKSLKMFFERTVHFLIIASRKAEFEFSLRAAGVDGR